MAGVVVAGGGTGYVAELVEDDEGFGYVAEVDEGFGYEAEVVEGGEGFHFMTEVVVVDWC
jgi:hypothetical protein